MDFIQHLTGKIILTDVEKEKINKAFKTERYTKGTVLMMPGTSSQKATYVEKGLLRTFYSHNDKDITHFFFEEGFVSMNIDSVFYNQPTPYGTEALEDVILRTIQYRDFIQLSDTIPCLKDYVFLTSVHMVKQFSDRLYSLQFHTAQERYTALLNDHPSILMRVPLGHIASYLGITQQTLSVIRAKTK
jgi:CRP-like cAMP-binding protein